MIAQLFLHSNSGCISHFGSDVRVEFVGQLPGFLSCEGWDLSVHRVQVSLKIFSASVVVWAE